MEGIRMNAQRALRNKIFLAVLDFLEDHYDYDFPRIDPDGSHTAEALELTQLIMDGVDPQGIWEDGYSSGAGDNYSGTSVGEIDSSTEEDRTPNPYEGTGREARQDGNINVERLRGMLRRATLYSKSIEYLSERDDL